MSSFILKIHNFYFVIDFFGVIDSPLISASPTHILRLFHKAKLAIPDAQKRKALQASLVAAGLREKDSIFSCIRVLKMKRAWKKASKSLKSTGFAFIRKKQRMKRNGTVPPVGQPPKSEFSEKFDVF